ncbi:hypothetical protein Ancab_017675 [Ancistrocladus abbreviatus]
MEKAETVFECPLESINPQSRRCRGGLYQISTSLAKSDICFFDAFGFGYDYKLLIKPGSDVTDQVASVCTASANSLSRVWDFPNYCFQHLDGCFANGVIHWVAVGYDRTEFTDKSCFIIGFDLGYETCMELQPPISLEGGSGLYAFGVELGVIEGRLSYTDSRQGMWIMREYGVEESWTKIITFSGYS